MKILIDRERTLPPLSLVSTVVEKRQTVPMLSNLFFELTNGKLQLVGTDMEVEISETITDVKGEDGAFTASTAKILDIARLLPENAEISIKQSGDVVELTSGPTRYKLKTLPSDEFPRIIGENWQEKISISQADLRGLLRKTAFAMAAQDVRYYLNGLLLQLSAEQLRGIATDGHRLAQSEIAVKSKVKELREMIVPRKAVQEIQRLLGNEGEEEGEDEGKNANTQITLEMGPNHLKLTKNGTTLITKLIDGKFPEFKAVLEKKPDLSVSVDRNNFIQTLQRVAILAASNDIYRGIKLTLDKNILRATASNNEQEEAQEEVKVDYNGEVFESGYNVSYLLDVAQASDQEMLELHIPSSEGICVLKQPGDVHTTWLIMPMRI